MSHLLNGIARLSAAIENKELQSNQLKFRTYEHQIQALTIDQVLPEMREVLEELRTARAVLLHHAKMTCDRELTALLK